VAATYQSSQDGHVGHRLGALLRRWALRRQSPATTGTVSFSPCPLIASDGSRVVVGGGELNGRTVCVCVCVCEEEKKKKTKKTDTSLVKSQNGRNLVKQKKTSTDPADSASASALRSASSCASFSSADLARFSASSVSSAASAARALALASSAIRSDAAGPSPFGSLAPPPSSGDFRPHSTPRDLKKNHIIRIEQ
jgi:hypothetical protein